MRLTGILLACVLLLALSVATPAQAIVKFDVRISGISLSDSEIEQIVVLVGDVQKACAEVLGAGSRVNQAVNLCIFGSQEEFQRYGGPKLASLGPAVGFYRTRPMEVVVWAQNSKERMRSTLLHECTHLFLHLAEPDIPIAMDEGLAEVLMNSTLENGTFRILPNPTWSRIAAVALSRDSLPDLDVFLDLSRQEWQRLDAQRIPMRAVSWTLAYWLMESESRQRILAGFLDGLSRSGGRHPSQVLAAAAGKRTVDLEKEWQRWISGTPSPISLSISSAGSGSRGVVFRQ